MKIMAFLRKIFLFPFSILMGTVPDNTFKTYESIGNREDLSDVITNISPVDTLFYSQLSEDGAKSVKKEWQTDSLAAAGANAQLEGDTTAATAVTPTVRLNNTLQIQKKQFIVSGTQEAIAKSGGAAGRPSELGYQTAKHTKELAKDVEYSFLRGVQNLGAAGTARQMKGALNFTITNLDKAGDAVLNADGTVTGGTPRALDETLIQTTRQNIFTAGGDPKVVYCGPFQKRQFSSFVGSGNYRRPVEEAKLTNTVDVYVDDFGMLQIKPHRNMPTDVVFIPDMAFWKKATLRAIKREELAKNGDAVTYHVIGEHTVVAKAENSSGRITNLTTAA
jgi:hypothetical protein